MAQFPNVSSPRGAPMGRLVLPTRPTEERTIRLFRVRLDSGGYDDGGAYWGIGMPLWCATDDADYREFVRSWTRDSAADKLLIPDWLLVRGRTSAGFEHAASINPLLAVKS